MGIDAEMIVGCPDTLTKCEVKRIAFELGCSFQANSGPLWITKEHHCVSLLNGDLDNFTYLAKQLPDAEYVSLLRVHLSGRYYGIGYERGYLPSYIVIAEWLERRLPGCRVFYGGDYDAPLELFDKAKRDELFNHYVKFNRMPYLTAWGQDEADIANPICAFCEEKMVRYGYGSSYASFSCHGCGDKKVTRDSGVTWSDKDLFDEAKK